MIGGIGTPELLLILVIFLMIFGVGKLPQVAKMLGSGVKSFRKGLSGEEGDEPAEKDKPELLEEDKTSEVGATEQKRQAERV